MFNDQDKKAVEGLIGFRDFDYSSNPIPRTDQFSTFFMTEFSERLPANLTPEIRAIMAEAFPGAPLLDMGCGFYPREPVLPLAVEFGSSAYLGIDITHSDHNIKNSPIPAYHINCDMLQFILVVGGNRANFVFNGITDFIDSEYTLHLVKELTRTTKPNGVIFGVGSPGLELKLKDHPAFYQPTALDSSYDTDFFLVRKRQ